MKVKYMLLSLLATVLLVPMMMIWLSLPQTHGRVELGELQQPIDIHFDEYARPFVKSDTLGDALFAQGWLHVSERQWQMELLRRAGRGRLSELLGASMLKTDTTLWQVGVPQLAMRLQANASPQLLQWVERYVEGINAAQKNRWLPQPELLLLRHSPKAWQLEDVFAVGALIAFNSGNNMENELLRLALSKALSAQDYALFLSGYENLGDYPYVVPEQSQLTTFAAQDHTRKIRLEPQLSSSKDESFTPVLDVLAMLDPLQNTLLPRASFGSNGWVVAPQKSATGKPLYAFDSHDNLGLPNLFYEVHLFYADNRQIRGWSVPGLPGVINGFNEAIAWGFTNIGDTQDLFIETRSEQDPLLFLDEGQWYRAESETVTIPVRDGDPVRTEVIHTRNGPLVSEQPALSLRWTTQQLNGRSLESILLINQARSWQEFNQAADDFVAPSLNATYADVHGNIGFRTAGALPVRGAGQGLYPLRGDVAANRWQGEVPAEKMPRIENPPSGFVAAANARVNEPMAEVLVSADNAAPYRIERLQARLQTAQKLTLDDMQALQRDWYDGQAAMLLPSLLAALEGQIGEEVEQRLRQWAKNPVASQDSVAALIFQRWYLALIERVFSAKLSPPLYAQLLQKNYVINAALDTLIVSDQFSQWWPEDKAVVMRLAMRDTLQALSKALGDDVSRWRLDQLQQVGLSHELSQSVPILAGVLDEPARGWGGGPAAVGRANYRYHSPFKVSHGATVRVVANMAEQPQVRAVIPGGQSGHFMSQHYSDQFDAWLQGRLLPLASAVTQVSQPADRHLRLLPAIALSR